MLILERRRTQYLAIGPEVKVFVDRINWEWLNGRQWYYAKLGICAPARLTILRSELWCRGQDLGNVATASTLAGAELPRRQYGRIGFRLVVGRGVEQRLLIGNDVDVFITAIGPRAVQIGVNAPRVIHVLRGEIYEREDGGLERDGGRCASLPSIAPPLNCPTAALTPASGAREAFAEAPA